MQSYDEFRHNSETTEHYSNYADYSRTLRAWLVAYGIGGPVLFVTNEAITKKIASSGVAREVVALFLLGVGLQIILALINKWSAWHMYRGAGDPGYTQTALYKIWSFINAQSWIDFWLDLVSLLALIFATYKVISVFVAL